MSTAAARRDEVRQSREEVRGRIVAAVRDLLRTRAFAELTVDEVMREAGHGRTIFYRHFDDLPGLLERASREAIAELYAAQRALAESADAADPGIARRALAPAVDVYHRHGRCCAPSPRPPPATRASPPSTRGPAPASTSCRAGPAPRGRARRRPGADRPRPQLMNESYLIDAFGREPRVDPATAVTTLSEALARRHPPLRRDPMDVFRTPRRALRRPARLRLRTPLGGGRRAAPAPPRRGLRPPVLCFHGEPSWSYLYRHMIGPLVAAGHRVVCPDLVGFGKSDKPTDRDWYTYDRHCESVTAHLDTLDLHDVTVVVQDWGGPIGLRWAVDHPGRVSRLVVMNTGLFTGRVSRASRPGATSPSARPTCPIGRIIQGATTTDLPTEVIAAYEAPFPAPESKAGAQVFPLLVPTAPDQPGVDQMLRVQDALSRWDTPVLVAFSDSDPVFPYPRSGEQFTQLLPTAGEQVCIEGAAHFLQEDRGPQIVDAMLAAFGAPATQEA